jgi:hypothetical protein
VVALADVLGEKASDDVPGPVAAGDEHILQGILPAQGPGDGLVPGT